MTNEKYDIVIIGGGPAGSAAAIRLASAGRKVLLVDKAKFPRHKLCGEFVSPECLRHFEELGISEPISELKVPQIAKTVFYSVRGRALTIPNSFLADEASHSIGLSRASMDNLLIRRAAAVGVDVRTVTSFRGPFIRNRRLAGVELRDQEGITYSVQAPIAIDATGRSRFLARSFSRTAAKKATLVAFKTHVRNAGIESGVCEIYSYSGGYGGCTEIENGLFNLCFIASAASVKRVGADSEGTFRRIVAANSRAMQVMQNAEFSGEWLSVPIAKFGREPLVPFAGVISIGDAAAFVDPFTGSGIALALESAKLASDAVTSSSQFEIIARNYERTHRAVFEQRLRFCRLLRLASASPLIAEATIGALARSSYLSGMFARATRARALLSG